MPRGRNQMSYFGQCPENEMPHMQRPPGPCFDNYPKMDGHCGMGVSEFKSPMMNTDPAPPPTKKKRRTSNSMSAAAQSSPATVMQDLCPPPLSGYGDTIVASNPFDDTPSMSPMPHLNPMNHVNKHMGVGPCMSPAGPPMMGSMSPCHIVGSPMSCGPPVGSPINCGPPMGNCSPMGGAGNNPNCGPVSSPHTSCSRQVSRSPLVVAPMNANPVIGNSSMSVNSGMPINRSPSSLGSPLSSVMASNVRGNSPLDCGLGINSLGSQKGSPMSVMGSHGINSLNCGSPMGSPSNVPLNNCNSNMMGSPITSPLSNIPCSLGNTGGNSDLGINHNSVMNRSPHSVPPSNPVSGPMMCNSSMRGPSPISSAPMNGPMGMNCNSNPSMLNMNSKPDINMNDLALRESCGSSHLPMKSNNGPSGCGMPVNNISCTRPSDLATIQCGPMNSPHCNPMMSNQCEPNINHGPCIGNGMSRAPCSPGMSINISFDSMNPQFRGAINRSQFPRGMVNMPYGPNSMNGPVNGPMNSQHMNSPMSNHMNGPNMNNMCAPSELNGLPGCGPNNSTNLHCVSDQGSLSPSINNMQCMNPNSMNPCPPPHLPNSMFNPPYSPFDMNNPRCSPNLNFHPNDMNVNNNFYRLPNLINAGPGPCMPNMHPSVVSTHASEVLSTTDSIVSSGNSSKNDPSNVDSDITNVVCGISNDASNDLNLLGDELLRDAKPDEQQQRKSIKDFSDTHLLLGDDVVGVVKNEELEGKPNKAELDAKISSDESKRDVALDKKDSSTPTSSVVASSSVSVLTSNNTCTTSSISTSCATSAVMSGPEATKTTSEIADVSSCGSTSVANVKSTEGANDDDDFVFKSGNSSAGVGSETHSNASGHSNNTAAPENDGSSTDDITTEDKVKNEPVEDKLLDGDFHNDDENSHFHKILNDDKSEANSNVGDGVGGNAGASSEDGALQGTQKEAFKTVTPTMSIVKLEGDELFDGGTSGGGVSGAGSLRKNDCQTSVGSLRPGGNGCTGLNMMPGSGPSIGFNVPSASDLVSTGVMPSSTPCMNESLCNNPMSTNMVRPSLPHNANHTINFPNRNMCKVYPINKSKVFNPQNPNAPPIYACGKCHKEINDNDQAILCESGCHFWYHRTCSGLTEIAYQFLTNEIYAEWACDSCLTTKNIPLVKYKP